MSLGTLCWKYMMSDEQTIAEVRVGLTPNIAREVGDIETLQQAVDKLVVAISALKLEGVEPDSLEGLIRLAKESAEELITLVVARAEEQAGYDT